MKNSFIILLLLSAALSFNFTMTTNSKSALFSWAKTTYDFGEIEQSKPVTAEFFFQNTGDLPLMIISTKGSCGCTVAAYTRGEIMPGEYGKVTATYNAAKVGAFSKTVTVNANTTDGPIILRIKGEVL